MIAWALRHVVTLAARLAVTCAGVLTVHQLIALEGYRCELSTLFISAAAIIVAVRVWMPWSKDS